MKNNDIQSTKSQCKNISVVAGIATIISNTADAVAGHLLVTSDAAAAALYDGQHMFPDAKWLLIHQGAAPRRRLVQINMMLLLLLLLVVVMMMRLQQPATATLAELRYFLIN